MIFFKLKVKTETRQAKQGVTKGIELKDRIISSFLNDKIKGSN